MTQAKGGPCFVALFKKSLKLRPLRDCVSLIDLQLELLKSFTMMRQALESVLGYWRRPKSQDTQPPSKPLVRTMPCPRSQRPPPLIPKTTRISSLAEKNLIRLMTSLT
ncbi:hypothetical protein K438DRAFT_9706 [Mycena galopus ATCC 62051]|nr:hypothetical protein K438DRAFT_9706 [Mycena galopus ATCC 62051]